MKEGDVIKFHIPHRKAWTHGSDRTRPSRIVHVTALIAASFSAGAACTPHGETLAGQQFETIEVASEEIHVSYFTSGNPSAQRIIFVHGTPGSAGAWTDYLEDAPKDFEYVAIDRPGFGSSSPDKAIVTLKEQAEAILPLLEERDGKWPILVGHSLGGPIIAKVAVMAPEKVGGLVIVAGSFDPDLEKIHFVQRLGELWPIGQILPDAIRNSNRELIALKPELETLTLELDQITTPTIVLHGTDDNLVPYSNVAFLQPRLKKASNLEVVRLEGRNHFLPWNSKQEIVTAYQRLAATTGANSNHAAIEPGGQTR
ncbi:MAG: alpha/beta hydrolase [Alphaproteobacteria bacterium]|nr:MAG: alpha/beta hydrolase [Alphaproteobacteria bacterium]